VACPQGPFANSVRELGVGVVPVPGTAGSLKLHPWHTARALAELGAESVAVRRLARRLGAQLVHANSIRAGMSACLGLRGALPTVVHLRDSLPPGRVAAMSLSTIDRWATLVLANSSYTRASFERVPRRARRAVLHSPVDLTRFRPGALSRDEARERLGLDLDAPVLAVLAQLTPWKGQDDAVRLLAHLRERFPSIRLLLVGSAKFVSGATRYDNLMYVRELEDLVSYLGCEHEVVFLGERTDVPEVLSAVDVLLAPSWEEPFGRSVVEAMAMEIPVIATGRGGPAETVRDGIDGFLVSPRRPDEWADPAARLLVVPDLRARMGASGRRRVAERFATEVIAGELVGHYRGLVGGAT
jgi:glycosyltransferase involved in cell wall biosynthesis